MVDDIPEEGRVEPALASDNNTVSSWLEPIYREHSTVVLQTAFRVTGSAEDAEDVLQTIFTRLARRADPPNFEAGSRAYLRRAATNAALDIVQSRRVRTGVSLEVVGDGAFTDTGPAPDRLHLGKELENRIRAALAGMSRRGAEIFVLRYFEGLSNGEIAEQLDTSAGTVAVTLHRVRARLKDELAQFMGGIQ